MLSVPSRLDQVTVFRQGARLTRLADISQPADGWPRQLRLSDLPLALLDATVSVSLEFPQGGGGWLARDVRVEVEPVERPGQAASDVDVAALERELQILQQRLALLDRDIEGLEKLEPGTLVVAEGQAPEVFPLQARRAVVQLRQKTLSQWIPRRQQLKGQAEAVGRKLNGWLACTRQAPLEVSKSVVVTLRSTAEAQAPHMRLWLSYQVEGASWAPCYSLRFDRDYSLARLDMRAMVCQSSGEDWGNVALKVSTADPAGWTELPELLSRRLGRQQPARLTPGWRPLPLNSEALLADYDGTSHIRRSQQTQNYAAPLPQLSDAQAVAVALMSISPEVAARIFKELGPELVQSITLEISRLPQLSPELRRQAVDRVLAVGADPEEWARQNPEGWAARVYSLLGSNFQPLPAPQPTKKMAPERQVESLRACSMVGSVLSSRATSSDLCDLVSDKVGSSRPESRLSSLVSSPAKDKIRQRPPGPVRWELSDQQLAFDLLYLPGADEEDRGRLQLQSSVQACLRRWPDPATAGEARLALERALGGSREAALKRPPAGYLRPEAIHTQDWLYQGESRVDLPGDCQFRSVPLLHRQLPAQLHWLVVPKVTCDVFRRVELDCPADLALAAGPVDLFVGPDYLASVEMQAVSAGESFWLDMGVETALRLVRNATFKEQTAGMMGGTLQLRHDVRIQAANHLARTVRLEVREALPEAQEGSECKVRHEQGVTIWEPLPDEEGYRCWIHLSAGEKVSFDWIYVIDLPSKLELVGGNRREK